MQLKYGDFLCFMQRIMFISHDEFVTQTFFFKIVAGSKPFILFGFFCVYLFEWHCFLLHLKLFFPFQQQSFQFLVDFFCRVTGSSAFATVVTKLD